MEELQKLVQDKELVKQLAKSDSPKSVYNLLAQNGLQMEYADFLNLTEKMKETYEKQKAGLLTDQDIDEFMELNEDNSANVGTSFLFFLIPGAI